MLDVYVGSITGGVRAEPVEDVERFIDSFNESYTGNVEMRPAFWRSSYSQALAAAKQELKFLLIYLHCKDHQHTDQFCRYVWWCVTLAWSDVLCVTERHCALSS